MYELRGTNDGWSLTSDEIVTRVSFDQWMMTILGDELQIGLEHPFVYANTTRSYACDPSVPRSNEALISLLGVHIATINVRDSGQMSVEFGDGSSISAEPSPDFEAWSVSSRRGLQIIAIPGGELAFWNEEGGPSLLSLRPNHGPH